MIWVALICIMIFIALVFVLLQRVFGKMLKDREMRIKTETTQRLQDFFVFIDPSALWSGHIVLSFLLALAVWAISGLWWLAGMVGVLVFLLPNRLVHRMRQRRLAQFDRQLPDMLLALAAALRAGAGVHAALARVTAEAVPPLSQEFALMQRQQRLGVPFEQSLDHLLLRMPSEASGLFVSALKIASQSGGNLAEALERIATTLQSRLQIQDRIRSLTSQGKMQAWVMAGLPLVLMLVLNALDPAAMAMMWHHPAGWLVLGLILFLETLGLWFILKIVNIDV
ncbi:type II secretion system protein [Advenella kashmirensis W13003]|uniref:Type II secretion system protein n=2 Tax=Advenella kashmirensis TaxID=310575 RepID=V8QRN1_9BURK|nr:type II secretion system protein [Advenella kashmirensis W13003]